MNTAMQKIVDFFEQQETLKQRKQEIIDEEKMKLKRNHLGYVSNYVKNTDNLLTVDEVRKCLEEEELEAAEMFNATKEHRYISSTASSNYNMAVARLSAIEAAKEVLAESLNNVTVSYFNENLADAMAKYEKELQEHESNQLTIEPAEVAE